MYILYYIKRASPTNRTRPFFFSLHQSLHIYLHYMARSIYPSHLHDPPVHPTSTLKGAAHPHIPPVHYMGWTYLFRPAHPA